MNQNQAFSEDNSIIYDQLSQDVKLRILKENIFPEFIHATHDMFRVINVRKCLRQKLSFVFYNWYDELYQKFMLDIMLSLEYHFEDRETIF